MSYYMLAAMQRHDAEMFEQYQKQTVASLSGYDCRPLSANAHHKVVAGAGEPDVVVLLEFPDEAEFDRWWESSEYAEVKHLRENSATVLVGVGFAGEVHLPV
jgi:uncharacterized protein (DUF1330 family)